MDTKQDWPCFERISVETNDGRKKEVRRTSGRPRMGMLHDLKEGLYVKMRRRADDREVQEQACRRLGYAERQGIKDDDDTWISSLSIQITTYELYSPIKCLYKQVAEKQTKNI